MNRKTYVEYNAIGHAHLDCATLVDLQMANDAVDFGRLFSLFGRGSSCSCRWLCVVGESNFLGGIFAGTGLSLTLAFDIGVLLGLSRLEHRERFGKLEEVEAFLPNIRILKKTRLDTTKAGVYMHVPLLAAVDV